jgi:hypothetical protein
MVEDKELVLVFTVQAKPWDFKLSGDLRGPMRI